MTEYTIIENHYAGMGAVFNSTIQTLESLIHTNSNLIPKIIWKMPYYSDDPDENIWDTYFELVNFPEIKPNFIYKPFEKSYKSISQNPRRSLNSIFMKYVRIKPILSDKLNHLFQGMSEYSLIGIHIRNTDRAIEPQYASPGLNFMIKYLTETIVQEIEKTNKLCLYLASDNIPDASIIKEFITLNWPSIKILEDPDAVRSPDQISVHGTHDKGLQTTSNSKKALSILTDIFALAKCNIVLRTCSNVTAASAILNLTTKYIDISKECGKFTEDWVTQEI